MKLNKTILAVALGLGMASLSHAGTVYMTGSTACRAAVYTTLTNNGAVFSPAPSVTLYSGGTSNNDAGSGATYMAFVGTLAGSGTPETIQCNWSGSEAGYLDICSNLSEPFMNVTLDGQDHGTNVPATASFPVNLAMGDNSQQFSRTRTPALSAGHSKEVAIITFEWVRNNGLWQGTNVTDSMIRQALIGFCVRGLFDGNASHTNDLVYVSGRDNLSGTRVNALGDTGYGIFNTLNQIEINSSGVMQLVNGSYAGDFGFSSGGSLAKTMGANTQSSLDSWIQAQDSITQNGFSVIAYLGVSDANTAIANGATLLTYDGVPFSATNVLNGTYTFWGNEYCNEANNVASNSDADKVFQLLYPAIGNFADGTKVISLSAMQSARNGPTTDPIHAERY